ncbi:MAG TPA: DEAD/DEAH box helicase, partial [Gemmatimonadaceae bacterium]|nr:DEAD/DEAH box helicase [Gemmatimonadaceae bacterium]
MRHGAARRVVRLTELHLRATRAAIAAACVPPPVDAQLGSITLRDDQRATTARVAMALARNGGCLLADDVGRGKTYVALAIARRWRRPLVVVPAALRATWDDAMRRAGVPCAMISHEALSRGRMPSLPCGGIVVDESHHFRSMRARRYAALASLASGTPLLLLSATPLQNRRQDLAAQIALFHGARAFTLDDAALATFVVRGASDDIGLPTVAAPVWVHPSVDDGAVLDAILALPSPARPADGGDAGVLRTIGLVRAWASTRAALTAAILRRRRIAAAIEQSVVVGRVPTRRDLSAWTGAEDAIQLGFASLLATTATDAENAVELAGAVAREHEALTRLEGGITATADPDDARVDALRRLRAAHPGERVLAFTEFAGSARAYFARMRGDPGVALLTATDAHIASGRLPRRALLERFAPSALGAAEPAELERVTLLIATDLLSEGMNLQDASVVVHLDLPWNPARLAQRVGRVRRPGGGAVVQAYLIAPPARGEVLLELERRLRRKLADAAHAIGRGIDVVPRLTGGIESASVDVGRAALIGETS